MAAMLLMSVCSFAQDNNTPLVGDVNEDGKVDIADVVAILKIMKDAGGTSEEPTYYWYVGQINPSTMTSISPIVTDTSSPGWRLIGNSIGTYSMNNPLWDGTENSITVGTTKATTYLALPNNSLKGRDSEGDELDALWISNGTKEINGVTYYIYRTPGGMKIFNSIIF